MGLVKNYENLATTKERKIVLELIETALEAIQPAKIIPKILSLQNNILNINGSSFDLSNYQRVILIGFGKGSAAFSQQIETILGDHLQEGYVIDVESKPFSKISFIQGTHPLPSEANFNFTQNLINNFAGKLSEKDLVLVVVCGGGSAMLVSPSQISLDKKIEVNKALLKSGADIYEMNTVRKHLSQVKGGGLAKILFPAQVATLIFSDVLGNDLSFIASGPTVLDHTTTEDAWKIIQKYHLENIIEKEQFSETPKEEKFFQNVKNQIVLSNRTALLAMQQKAQSLGFQANIYTDQLKGEAKFQAEELIKNTPSGSILLAAGETTVKVIGGGEGGRNQETVLGALPFLKEGIVITSFDSDGWDNSDFAGAIADSDTAAKAESLHLDTQVYLNSNCSLEFFRKVGDGITTGRLPANVSDLFIVFRQ